MDVLIIMALVVTVVIGGMVAIGCCIVSADSDRRMDR